MSVMSCGGMDTRGVISMDVMRGVLRTFGELIEAALLFGAVIGATALVTIGVLGTLALGGVL